MLAYARCTILGKFAPAAGAVTYVWQRKLRRRSSTWIEYKHSAQRRTGARSMVAQSAAQPPV